MAEQIVKGIVAKIPEGYYKPSGKKIIRTTEELNVRDYATAQVYEPNLIPENIAKDVKVLGVVGTHEGGAGGIIPSGTIEITENGTYDVTGFEIANVNTPVPTGTLEVTENGEHDVTSYEKVNVAVAGSGESTLKKLLDFTKSTAYMFYKNTEITDITGFIEYNDTENVENMENMFEYCTELITAPQFNVSSVTRMTGMFYNCKKLTFVPQLNTPSLTITQSMFSGCLELINAPLLLTDKVTNANSMFSGCKKLKNVPQYDFTNVININYIHSGNEELEELPPLNLTNCETMNNAFSNCTKLKKLVLKTTNKFGYGQELYYAFYNCYNLKLIDLYYYYCGSSTNNTSVFANCYSLKALVIRKFRNYSINSKSFNGCYRLLGTQDATYNPEGLQDGYIYIPRDMIETLSSATNWSTHATQLRALEDYTLDGTTTGELDLAKMGLE